MTCRRIAALLGVPLVLGASWTLGGTVFDHPQVDLGSVVVVGLVGDQPGKPAAAPSRGTPAPTGNPSAPEVSPPPVTAAPPVPVPTSVAESAAPTGASRVTAEPAPVAGDDDDDDDGIEDGGLGGSTDDSGTDHDDDGVDDDTDS